MSHSQRTHVSHVGKPRAVDTPPRPHRPRIDWDQHLDGQWWEIPLDGRRAQTVRNQAYAAAARRGLTVTTQVSDDGKLVYVCAEVD